MRILRRLLRYLTMAVAVVMLLLLLGVATTQTGWFKDWLRRYIVREAAQYLHGELRIGGLSGNLFYGLRLSDIALVQDGETIVALKDLKLDYSAIRIISSGVVLDEIELNQPVVVARRTADGWNLMRLVKRQARERERTGPARPVTLPSIVIHDGQVTIDRGAGAAPVTPAAPATSAASAAPAAPAAGPVVPPASGVTRIQDLDVQAAFAYQPVNFTIDIGNISFRATDPTVALSKLSGKVTVAGDDIHVDDLLVRLPESELKADGVVREYKKVPRYELALESRKVTFQEIGVLLPVVRNMTPQPSFRITTSGPLDRLQMLVDVRSAAAGTVAGTVTLVAPPAGSKEPRHLEGDVQVARLNLAPWLKNESWEGLVTGHAVFDLRMPDAARGLRLAGTYHFTGPAAGAFGYAGEDIDARGRFEGARVEVEQSRARAYGTTTTATGTLDASDTSAITYRFKGRTSNVDLRRVPKQLSIPPLESRLDLDYQVSGVGKDFKGLARLHPSTVEGARFAAGTTGHFELKNRRMSYGAEGSATDLDLRRLGRALDLDTLASERFEGRVNGRFRVEASGRSIAELVLTSDGVLADTTLFGAHYTDMAFEARLDRGVLAATAKGDFAGFNPTTFIDNTYLDGNLAGVVDGRVTIPDVRESITLDNFGFDGTVQAKDSTLFDLSLASASFDGAVGAVGAAGPAAGAAAGGGARATIRQLTVDGPDIAGTAAGTLALDRVSASDVTYRFTVPDLARLGKRAGQPIAGQPIAGSADFGGKVTGNLAELNTAGTARVTSLRYADTADIAVVDSTYDITLPDMDTASVRAKAHIEASTIKAAGREIPTLTGDVTYANREAGFTAHAVEGPRTFDASGRALFQDGRQEVHLSKLALSTQGVTWQTREATDAVIVHDGTTVNVAGLQLVNGPQRISADGVVGVEPGTPSTLKIVAEGIDLAEAEQLVGTDDPRLAGLLSATATVKGSLREPAIDTQFAIAQGAFRDVQFESLGGHAAYDARRLTLDVRLEQSPGTALTAKGTLPVSLFASAAAAGTKPAGANAAGAATGADETVDLHVQSTPVDLGLIQGLTTAVSEVTGRAQLDMRVKGQGRDVAFDGYVKVDQGAFTVTQTGVPYTGLNTTLHFEPSRLVVEGLHVLDSGKDPLEVKGVLGLTGTKLGALDLTAQAKAFEVLNNELGEVDVNMDLRIQGELAEPRVGGTVSIRTGRVEIDRLLRRLTAGAYATESAAAIPAAGLRESAAPSSRTRPTPASTPAVPPGPPEPGAAPPATQAPAAQAPGTPAAGTAAAGTPAPGTPQASPSAGAPQPPGRASSTPATASQAAASAAGLEAANSLNRIHLDLHVQIPDNLVLRGKDLRVGTASMGLGNINVTVGGDLRVLRQPAAPTVVLGNVNTVRGTYDYRGRRFDILRDGRIAFQGQSVDNPLLDVTAERVIEPSGVEARIRIQGTARRPQLNFSSKPPMDESDVIALIVFNRPLSDLESGERGTIAELAGSTAAGFLVSPLADTLGRALDLDLFEVGTTSDAGGGTGGVVTAGKQIDERLFFKFRQQFGGQEVSEFILEYQLARFLRLQGSAADGEGVGRAQRSLTRRIERAGLDLIFYFSY